MHVSGFNQARDMQYCISGLFQNLIPGSF